MVTKWVAVSCLFMLLSLSIQGQPIQYQFRQLSIENGLPGQNVRQVYQDHLGIIWISVEAIGLCRYNGREFELFDSNPNVEGSISNNYVNAIIEDAQQNLWIATERGLNRYERPNNTFKVYLSDSLNKSGLPSDLINCLYLDKLNNLWVGTGNGLCYYNRTNDKFEYIPLLNNNSDLPVNAIIEHSSGEFFLGTNLGLIQYNPQKGMVNHWQPNEPEGCNMVHRFVRSIIEDNQGNLWIGTHRGLNKFDFKRREFMPWHYLPSDAAQFENEGYNSVYTRDQRYIWFASYTSGIVIIDAETNRYQRLHKDLPFKGTIKSNHIRSIFQDRGGLLWISTKFEGIFIYDSHKDLFNRLPEKYSLFQPLKNSHILSFYKDAVTGLYWVGTKYEGLFKIDPKNNKIEGFKHDIKQKHSLASNRIQEILRTSDNLLLVGMGDGLDLLNEKTNMFTHLSNLYIEDIIEDSHGNIWVGTSEGLFLLDRNTFKLKRYEDCNDPYFKNEGIQITYLYIDKGGNLWISTRFNGLYCYNPYLIVVKHYSTQNPETNFMSDSPRGITEDKDGRVLIGTKSAGLCIYNPLDQTMSYLNEFNGLASNFVISIQRDMDFNFWLGTHNGLSFLNPKTNQVTNFTTVHGLQGNIFELDANGIFDDGSILFGGHNGLNIFNPQIIEKFNAPDEDSILITSIKVFDTEISRDIDTTVTLKLNHKQNYITFEFVLTDYAEPLRHAFVYRMLGISDAWFNLQNRNYIAFSSLKPGEYTFEVKGTNEFGVLNKQPRTVHLIIKPPFYGTIWFQSLFLLSLLLGIFLFIQNRVRSSRNIRLYLAQQVQERTEELQTVNEELVKQNKLIEAQKAEIEVNKVQLEEKVRARTADLEKAKLLAEQADNLKSAFLANMSHEIRTPLNAILGFSSLIVESVQDNPDFNIYTESIENSSEMLLKIIDDILDISKIEAKQLEVRKTEVNLSQLLHEVYITFMEQKSKMNLKHVEIELNNPYAANEQIMVHTDPFRLRQVLFNLMSNALKFTCRGYIEIGLVKKDDLFELYVKDTGIGIKPEDLALLFTRFVKIENSPQSIHRGNGLGLSLCKSLVELLGGTIWVESNYGYGSTFTFTIPAVENSPSDKGLYRPEKS